MNTLTMNGVTFFTYRVDEEIEAVASFDDPMNAYACANLLRKDGWTVTVTPVLDSQDVPIFYNLTATQEV